MISGSFGGSLVVMRDAGLGWPWWFSKQSQRPAPILKALLPKG